MDKLRLKTPVTYYGGKQKLLREILSQIPDHSVYVEPFFGGGAVFFGKETAPLEIINDLNSHVINFYFCLKGHFRELNKLVQSSLHSREAPWSCTKDLTLFNRTQRAWSFWILTNQGFAGKIGSWGYNKKKAIEGIKIFNKKLNFGKHLEERLELVQIECKNALKVIQNRDSERTFHYVDPPYFNSNFGHYAEYSEQDFRDLLEVLSKINGKFLLSSYPFNVLDSYREKYKWSTFSINQKITASNEGKGNSKLKTEVLTANYELT